MYTYFLSTYLTLVGVVNIAKYLILTPTGSCDLTLHHHSPFFFINFLGSSGGQVPPLPIFPSAPPSLPPSLPSAPPSPSPSLPSRPLASQLEVDSCPLPLFHYSYPDLTFNFYLGVTSGIIFTSLPPLAVTCFSRLISPSPSSLQVALCPLNSLQSLGLPLPLMPLVMLPCHICSQHPSIILVYPPPLYDVIWTYRASFPLPPRPIHGLLRSA